MLLWGFNTVLGVSPGETLKIVDYGDIEIIPVEISKTMGNITQEISHLLQNGVTVIALGGDHSVSLPLLRARGERI